MTWLDDVVRVEEWVGCGGEEEEGRLHRHSNTEGRCEGGGRVAMAEKGSDKVWARVGSSVQQSSVVQKGRRAADNTARFSKKLLWSTGKAAWIAGTSFLVLVVPLIIEMDREQQMVDLESQQAGLLGAPPPPSLPSLAK